MQVVSSSSTEGRIPFVEGYRIVGQIGSGGVATVYEAERIIDDEPFALKVIPTTARNEVVSRFELEAQIGFRLRHPDIVRVHDFGRTADVIWIAMDRLQGRDLKAALLDPGLSFEDRLAIVIRVARALHVAHESGVLHRDVKPSNIFLTEDDGVRLLDFGISKVAGFDLTRTNVTAGTPRYMAPEQIVGAVLDRRVDQFALAVVAYECFTGHFPWESDTPYSTMVATCVRPPTSFEETMRRTDWFDVSDSTKERLHHAIHRALESETARRFNSMEAFADALESALLPPEVSLPESTCDHELERDPSTWVWAALVAAFGILTVVALIGVMATG